MQLDLYPIIQPLISSYHRLYVSGLGTFSEKYIAAKEDSINGKILPPDTIIVFEPGGNGDSTLFHNEVKRRFSVDDAMASEAIRLFSKNIHDALDLHNSVELPNLGRLYYNVEHKIAFVPRLKVFENDSFGLPEVPFVEISPEETQVQKDIGTNMMPPVPPSNPMMKFVVFSIIFVALAVGIYYMVTAPFMESKLVKVKEMFEAWNDDTNEEKKNINPVVDLVDTSDQVVDFPVNEEDDKPVIKAEPVKNESTEEPTYVKIAIGVFGNPDNAARVIAKIEKAGFIPFSEKVGSLTKVGVKQEYKSVAEKLQILDKVRSDIEKTAIIIN
ncbi:MAG: hypothetical protein RL656_1276 [Bacteroidota bacterium]